MVKITICCSATSIIVLELSESFAIKTPEIETDVMLSHSLESEPTYCCSVDHRTNYYRDTRTIAWSRETDIRSFTSHFTYPTPGQTHTKWL